MPSLRYALSLFAIISATTAMAQVGGSPGGVGGASGAATSGTAGVNSSIGTPAPGTPGTPGPVTGAGIPGGSGPGATTVVPSYPSMPQPSSSIQRDSGGKGSPALTAGTSGSPAAGDQGPVAAREAAVNANLNFNPGAVTDNGLDLAINDIGTMPLEEKRDLLALFESCTIRGHAVDRTGRCGALNSRYRASYAKDRNIDRSLKELGRVVRFQSMFKPTGPRDTRFEDGINNRLRESTKTNLAASIIQRDLQADRANQPPIVTRDVGLPK